MLSNVFGRYYPINSRIHKMSSISKVLCTLIFIIATLLCNKIEYHVVLLFLLLFVMLDTCVPFIVYLKTILSLKWLLLFILIINLIFKNDIASSLIMIFKIIYMLLSSTILTLTTTPTDLTYGLQKVMSPLNKLHVPVNRIALSLSLALRFIPTIIDQSNKILRSQASRGVDDSGSNIKGKLISLNSLIIPMFSLTMKRADNLSDAMEVRLYDIDAKRTNFRQNKWQSYDTFLLVLHIIVLVAIVIERVV